MSRAVSPLTPWHLVSARYAFKVQLAYLKRRHRSGRTRATHGAILELLFFGTHLDGVETVERWKKVIVLELRVYCARVKDEWRAGI
jgi:hypothetical protein